jgi:WD40 repeat protein
VSESNQGLWSRISGPTIAIFVVFFLSFSALWARESQSTAEATKAQNAFSLGLDEQGALLFWNTQEPLLFAVALDDFSRRQDIPLRAVPQAVTPTPGGVSVFVTYPGLSVIDVISATDFSLQKTIETDKTGIQDLTFSPKGQKVFLTYNQGRSLAVYNHRLLELKEAQDYPNLAGTGPLVPNRRATRLYRAGEAGAALFFAANLQALAQSGASVTTVDFQEPFQTVWALDQKGHPLALEPQDLRVQGQYTIAVQGLLPLAGNSDSVALALGEEGQTLYVFNPSRDTPQSYPLGWPADSLLSPTEDQQWLISADGRVTVYEYGGKPQATNLNLFPSQRTFTRGVVSRVQTGGGFACF